MNKIVLGFPVSDELVAQIRGVAGDSEVIVSAQSDLPENLMQANVFCGHAKVPVDWEAVVAEGKLSWIQSTAAGLDHCLHPAVVESDIDVSGASALFANQVAEQTMALLMCLVRRIPTFFRAQQNRIYERKFTDDLTGKNVGIVGLGGNGQRIAQVLRPFVPRIIGTDCFLDQKIDCVDEVFAESELLQVLNQSDVVIITLPLTPSTRGLIGADELNAMRPDAYLVNVGRGSVVDTKALISKIEKFSGVGLDVVDPEPLPKESPLWEMENVMITPHVGAQSSRRLSVTTDFFCENIRRRRAGEALLNLVDKGLGFPSIENRVPLGWQSKMQSNG